MKFNAQWIRDRAAEGYRFMTIGSIGSNSPYYKVEQKILAEIGLSLPRVSAVGSRSARVPVADIRRGCGCVPGRIAPWRDLDCGV